MKHVRFAIIGAGPSGLSFANRLLELGETSFVVLEREREAGGLSRSEMVDGSPLDIGGGHFLDTSRPAVLEFLFRFMPREEWAIFDRISTIRIHGTEIDYPFEANLWQLPVEQQVEYLESIAAAGCNNGKSMPENFSDWIRWKLGDRIAADYMLPYNRKIWSIDLDRLGTYWLHKLPSVSFRETLLSCLERRPAGRMPAHATFFYPKQHGYGEVWRRMGAALKDHLVTGWTVAHIDAARRVVDGEFAAEQVIMTAPWPELLMRSGLPADIGAAISRLEYSSVETAYYPQSDQGRAHWVYIPDESVPHHRILNRYNFCAGSRGYWTESNLKRVAASAEWHHVSDYAYPLNTREKPAAIERVLEWAAGNGIRGLGRWGEWQHMNSDVAVERGMKLAETVMAGDSA